VLLEIIPTNKNALRFWVLQRYNATHIRALVATGIGVVKIATDAKQPLYALVDFLHDRIA
jgi:hypothetical protein